MKTQERQQQQEYKIQTRTLWGWADLKFSEDGHNYYTETFLSRAEADSELQDLIESLEDAEDDYRVIIAEEPEDVNLYQ
jgi:hypothetical protein